MKIHKEGKPNSIREEFSNPDRRQTYHRSMSFTKLQLQGRKNDGIGWF